jgi:RHS repeat-associated protein
LDYLSPGNGELISYGSSTSYQNSLLGVIQQIPAGGTATTYVRAPNGAPLAQRASTTSKQELFSDALGSTIAMGDDGANALARSYAYDPDGNTTTSGSGASTNLLFATGQQVGSLYHYGARYYDPTTATWTQQDPINQITSLTQANHYTYAGSNPINNTDPTGLSFLSDAADVVKSTVKGAAIGAGTGCIVGGAAGLAAGGVGAVPGCLAGGAEGTVQGSLIGGGSELARKVEVTSQVMSQRDRPGRSVWLRTR